MKYVNKRNRTRGLAMAVCAVPLPLKNIKKKSICYSFSEQRKPRAATTTTRNETKKEKNVLKKILVNEKKK